MNICNIEGCEKNTKYSICEMHRARKRRGQCMEKESKSCNIGKICSVADCGRDANSKNMCKRHYDQVRKYGKVLEKPKNKRRIGIANIGDTFVNSDGYVMYKVGEHPNCPQSKKGWMLEHTYVMSVSIGRSLYPEEEVHHKNGVRTDNRLENLELWSKSHPPGQRVEDLLAWAREILDRYDEPELLALAAD